MLTDTITKIALTLEVESNDLNRAENLNIKIRHRGLEHVYDQFHMHKIDLQMISFMREPKVHENKWHFANYLEDCIVISSQDNDEVQLVDLYDSSKVIYACACSFEAFIAVMGIYAEYLKQELEGYFFVEDEKEQKVVASCELAGGGRFRPFFEKLYLLGDIPIINSGE